MNDTTHTPPAGNIPLPLAIVRQWLDANDENTETSWAYVAGMASGALLYRHDIIEELAFLVCIATQRGLMARKGGAE